MATMNAPASERRHIMDRRTKPGGAIMSKLNVLDWVAMVLLTIGGLNWGMVGLFSVDVVAALFGVDSPFSRLVYVVIGLAALYSIYTSTKLAAARH